MPYFTRQAAPNGSLIVIAMIGVSQARRAALIADGQPVPNAIQIQAMIDTGASCTCIDPSVLNQLSLTPTGSTTVNTPTTGQTPAVADQYDVSVTIYATDEQPPLVHHTMPVLKSELLIAQGFHALIGMDVLKGCLLTVDGMNHLFSLAY